MNKSVTGMHKMAGRVAPNFGFTLIELMIVVAVVAILAAIAYPSYQDQVRKSRRAQAKADLVEMTQILERYRTVNSTYVPASGSVPGLSAQSPRDGVAQYAVAISNQAANTFTLTATPSATTGQNKDKCGALSIDQANVKKAAGVVNTSCF
jgi:type IV pilus assembly protein PilE